MGLERSLEVEGLLRRLLRSIAQSDADGVAALTSADSARRVIGTDAREWFAGREWDIIMAQLPEYAAAGGFAIDVLDAEGFEEGAVGWAAANCSAHLGGQPDFPLRVSVVVRLEGGHWHVIQMHCSVGAPNEATVGIELTTTLEAVADAVRTDRPQLGVSAAPDGTVTVLFTDIEDSTKLAEQLGDQRWMELLRWHRQDVQKAATRHRGFVVKSLGDGFMIAFASASEAIRCAAEVRDSSAAGWEDCQFRVRAGIHSGDVIRDLDDFYGHAVIVAARVAGVAHGGDILVTGVVRELVWGAGFRFSEPRDQHLKGIDREVEVVTLLP